VDDEGGLGEISIRFRMAIKMDAGISKALALDEELVVATAKPAAIQCIRWTPDSSGTQMSTELLSRIPWISKKTTVVDMVYDRAMNLTVWITADGQAYAVQRLKQTDATTESNPPLFHGYCFHTPDGEATFASRASVNARFSLLAVSCANGEIWIYTAKDYAGNIVFSHKMLPFGLSSVGKISFLSYSPDGYCLFAGCQKGWMTWSVFGKPGGSSTLSDKSIAEKNQEPWLHSISAGAWLSGGSEILLTADHDDRLWILQMARSAVTGCFSSANLLRGLLQTSSDVVVYRGHELPDLTSISGEASLWHHAQYPASYLLNQWPIRCCVVSSDGRYVAIAGRRGLAHYSVNSGRWKTFDDPASENSFAVRGGMCWYGHVLVAATESDDSCEVHAFHAL
jgi:RAB6A-GEF complex partner protein 1